MQKKIINAVSGGLWAEGLVKRVHLLFFLIVLQQDPVALAGIEVPTPAMLECFAVEEELPLRGMTWGCLDFFGGGVAAQLLSPSTVLELR